MRIDRALLVLIIALWVVTVWTFLTPEPDGALGAPHPEIAAMRSGGAGLERHGPVLFLGWASGAIGIVFYVALMAFGTRGGERRRGIAPWLLAGLVAFLVVWTGLVLAYGSYMRDGPGVLVLGVPVPTAIMLYVLFPTSLVFTLIYVVGFDRWVLTPDDEAAYERLLAERDAARRRSSDDGRGTGEA